MSIDISRLSPHAQKQIREEQARRASERQARKGSAVPETHRPEPHQSRGMNSWEQDYAARLAADPTVAWYAYEPIRLRLAKNTGYTPDFVVVRTNGAVEAHEVKGFWRDDARVKIKVAAEVYTFIRFLVVTRSKGAFKVEAI